MNEEINDALKLPDVAQKLAAQGIVRAAPARRRPRRPSSRARSTPGPRWSRPTTSRPTEPPSGSPLGPARRDPPARDADDLRRLPAPRATPADCACARAGLPRLGVGAGAARANRCCDHLGTLRDAGDDEPDACEEWHAGGTRYGSPQAPIAPGLLPVQPLRRSGPAARCGRGFLQYTEFGGYYVDHRLREVDPKRVLD